MQFTTVFTILAAAAAVSAYPGSSAEAAPKAAPAAAGGVKNNGNVCPKGQAQSCCKQPDQGILAGLLGGSCELNILGDNCQQIAACCQIDQNGSLVIGGSCGPLLNI